MSDRTPEQKTADEALTVAIEAAHRAYGWTSDEAWLMSEYIVLTAAHRYGDDGEPYTAVGTLYRDGDVSLHRALGLIEFAGARMRRLIMEDDE